MQYFTTAQAAVCLARHSLIAHRAGDVLHIESPPWPPGSSRGIHIDGLAISGAWDSGRVISCSLRNAAAVPIEHTLRINNVDRAITLPPGAETRLL